MDQKQKTARYQRIKCQLTELFRKTNDPVARMSTTVAILYHKFGYYFWTGFYQLIEGELTVGPYQGSVACLILAKHKGVCWSAIDNEQTVIVADVHEFPGHIACDSRSKSEIVVPVRNKSGEIVAVLDVDSKEKDSFDEIDGRSLEEIVELIFSN